MRLVVLEPFGLVGGVVASEDGPAAGSGGVPLVMVGLCVEGLKLGCLE